MDILYPIGYMYAIYIYGNIYHPYGPYTPNVSIYTSTMDPMIVYIYDKIDMEPIVFFSNETGFTCFFWGVKEG